MTTFLQRLRQHYLEAPDRNALVLQYSQRPDQPITYRNLLHGAAGYALELEQVGVKPGEVVILLFQHSDTLIYSFFGAVLSGAIPAIMPFLTEKLSPEIYRKSLVALFEITRPTAVVTYPEFKTEVIQAIRDTGGTVPAPRILSPAGHPPPVTPDFESLGGWRRSTDDIVLLQHSSGTTGLQKGVALSHRSVFNQLESYSKALHLSSVDVVVSWLPLYHDMGLIAGFLMPILERVPVVLMSPLDWVRAPYRLFQAITSYRGTLTWLPNFAYNFCAQKIRERDLGGVDLSSLRAVINCSEPMYQKSHDLFLQRFSAYNLQANALATCYAMAENVFAVTQGGVDSPVTLDHVSLNAYFKERLAKPATDGEPAITLVSAGKPIANTRVCVLDQDGSELQDRHIGEIALQSNCMLSGYFNRKDLTTQAFHNGWYLTGDLGYLAQGEVYITGRKKDLIIVGGKNIYPQDLETLASEVNGVHPGRVVAFGIPNEDTGTEDVVIIAEVDLPKNNPNQTNQENHLSIHFQRIADDIRTQVTRGSDIALRYVKTVERGWLIKTSSGKVARAANREKYLRETRI